MPTAARSISSRTSAPRCASPSCATIRWRSPWAAPPARRPVSAVPLIGADGRPNHSNVAAAAAVTGRTINIPDAYDRRRLRLQRPARLRRPHRLPLESFLTVPLENHDGDVMGVLQLVNSRAADGTIVPFATELVPLIEALASQAAVALDNQMLLAAQKNLFRAFLQVFAGAIDAKSPYTGGHCRRVPELTTMLARAAAEAEDGPFAGFQLTDDEWYELEVAGGLHDCGKVTTPRICRRQGDQARDHLQPHPRDPHPLRGGEARCRDRVSEGGAGRRRRARRCARGATPAPGRSSTPISPSSPSAMSAPIHGAEKVARLERIAQITWQRTLDDRLGMLVGGRAAPHRPAAAAPVHRACHRRQARACRGA